VARALGSEEKNEFWYVAEATPAARLFVGLRRGATRKKFEQAVKAGTAQELVHHFPVKTGDALFLPSGRLHAVGAGNLLVEVQQNSDTTYRVFDWNRKAAAGKSRKLHIEESLRSINFSDFEPALTKPIGETLVKHDFFQVDKWKLSGRRESAPAGRFAIFACLEGEVECAAVRFKAGEFFLVPASLPERSVAPRSKTATVLRTTIP
jgi:mannose-6-phosphate isomerase